jgi:hypothetical protein
VYSNCAKELPPQVDFIELKSPPVDGRQVGKYAIAEFGYEEQVGSAATV